MTAAEHQGKSNRFKNKKPHSHRMQTGVLVIALLCGIGAVGGIAGTNAFFTDKAEINSSANAGTMSMKVIDLSDIEDNSGTLNADGSVTGAIKKPGYQGVDVGGGAFTMPLSRPLCGLVAKAANTNMRLGKLSILETPACLDIRL